MTMSYLFFTFQNDFLIDARFITDNAKWLDFYYCLVITGLLFANNIFV